MSNRASFSANEQSAGSILPTTSEIELPTNWQMLGFFRNIFWFSSKIARQMEITHSSSFIQGLVLATAKSKCRARGGGGAVRVPRKMVPGGCCIGCCYHADWASQQIHKQARLSCLPVLLEPLTPVMARPSASIGFMLVIRLSRTLFGWWSHSFSHVRFWYVHVGEADFEMKEAVGYSRVGSSRFEMKFSNATICRVIPYFQKMYLD